MNKFLTFLKKCPFVILAVIIYSAAAMVMLYSRSAKSEMTTAKAVLEAIPAASSADLTKAETEEDSTEMSEQLSAAAEETADRETEADEAVQLSGQKPARDSKKDDTSKKKDVFSKAESDYFDDALFIGNSRTQGLYMYNNRLKNADFYADEGMSIWQVWDSSCLVPPLSGSTNSLQAMLSSKSYGKIYIMFGINEIGTGTDDSFAEEFSSVIENIRSYQPEAIIYIESSLNVSRAKDAEGDIFKNSRIKARNDKLKALADNENIFYLDVNEAVTDKEGFLIDDYSFDGVHLTGSATSRWEDYLYSHAVK